MPMDSGSLRGRKATSTGRSLLVEQTVSQSEAAEMYATTPTTIRRWISEGRIRGYRFGSRAIRVRVDDLEGLFVPIGPGEIE